MEGITPYEAQLAPGNYKVTVSKEGYVTQEKTVTVVAGETVTEDFVLAVEQGTLRVTSTPTGAAVTVAPVANAD